MAKSIFNVVSQNSGSPTTILNVLAQDANNKTGLQIAVKTGLDLAGSGARLQFAQEMGNRPIELEIPAAAVGEADEGIKAVYEIQFRPASGVEGTSPQGKMVLSNHRRKADGTVFLGTDLAIQTAESATSATATSIRLVGTVDVDTTGA